ncbi:Ski2p [Rhizophagus irregularis DAOM 197198w]|uniref:Ski2p n=1 Tax=Rhizophagus irregularis (strain DAOM 197198w) TaxID=1432141 RepID=A0A015JYT4_RHIIW|nr:Ski2p [Rhizophagus irregularis DAOM 197198w]
MGGLKSKTIIFSSVLLTRIKQMDDIAVSVSTNDILNEELLVLPVGLGRPLSREEVQRDIEERYLIPRTSFPTSWLFKCQQLLEREPDFISLTVLEPSKPRTTLEIARDGPDGKIIGYKEVVVTDLNLTVKNSTSLLREPGSINHFVRGASSQFPFTPGGLEPEVMVDAEVINDIIDKEIPLSFEDVEILSIPPGFDRGLIFEDEKDRQIRSTNKYVGLNITDMITHDEDELTEFLEPLYETEDVRDNKDIELVKVEKNEETEVTSKDIKDEDSVDNLLPTQPPPLEGSSVASKVSKANSRKQEWAHEVKMDMENFKELVPELAYEFKFELDIFQKQAIYHLENGDSVFVAAHTSAGKTAVAEYAISLASKHMTRTIYTSPIKALSNQKYSDFKTKFDDVGILTGDIQIRPEASCLIMTTEILRSMLYKGADLIRDVEFVIFDEVHYINDSERGVVWEEVIIMLPAHVNLVLLSATVPNTKEFADWIGRTKKKEIYVISTYKRPVPLEHYLYAENELYKIVDAKKVFSDQEWKKAQNALNKEKESKGNASDARGGRGGRGGRGRGSGRNGTRQRGRGGGGGDPRAQQQQNKNLWTNIINLLKKRDLLPVINFTFSKKRCDDFAAALSNLDLCTNSEKSEIHVFIEKSLTRLNESDKSLPQVLRIRELLKRGIAVHHGGLLPIIKEMVEILFGRKLVKVLFATETFAMGINMPARTVVFSEIRKHDGKNFRDLLPGEYTQMSGRAGRRDIDKFGYVIITPKNGEVPNPSLLDEMILGKPTKLESKFRLTYNMILNLLRVEALQVEDMIKRSFSENKSQKMLPMHEKSFAESENRLSTFQKLECSICTRDINDYYDVSADIVRLTSSLYNKLMNSSNSHLVYKALSPGRIVIINNGAYRNVAAGILRQPPKNKTLLASAGSKIVPDDKTYKVFTLLDKDNNMSERESSPLPVTKLSIPNPNSYTHKIDSIPYRDIAFITKSSIKINSDNIDKGDKGEISRISQELLRYADTTQKGRIIEYDWSRISELDFRINLEERDKLMEKLILFQCIMCTEFIEHYKNIHKERLLKRNLDDLKNTISEQNLELYPDFEQRIGVLQKLNYIDEDRILQLKGRVACGINSADELIVTELIFENVLADYEAEEIVALLSCFIFQEKNKSVAPPNLTPRLKKGLKTIYDIACRVDNVQLEFGISPSEDEDFRDFNDRNSKDPKDSKNFRDPRDPKNPKDPKDPKNSKDVDDEIKNIRHKHIKYGLVEVVHEWAKKTEFIKIKELTDVSEGSIVRCITRLDETCREVKSAARIIGDSSLFNKMEEAQQRIKRDIVFAKSLYF